jgi:hypothetical protein
MVEMKTTLDLPESLIKQVKLRALHDGRKLKDAVEDLLRKGLAVARRRKAKDRAAVIARDRVTGLPVILCERAASPEEALTPTRADALLLAQEVEWHHAAGG